MANCRLCCIGLLQVNHGWMLLTNALLIWFVMLGEPVFGTWLDCRSVLALALQPVEYHDYDSSKG